MKSQKRCDKAVEARRAINEAERKMPTNFAHKAALHYAKALHKHPHFADKMHDFSCQEDAEKQLERCRDKISFATKWPPHIFATDLLLCEMLEAWTAQTDRETISELYDAVAVLMRMIAVVEGKQTLGGKVKSFVPLSAEAERTERIVKGEN